MAGDTRKGRFERRATKPIALTTRDADILLALHKYRFLTSEQLMALTGTVSRWGMNKRLRQLYDHKFIDRPKAQHALFSYAEKRPTIYALGHKGASLLRARFGIAMPPSVYWTEKNRRVREHYIQHTLGIADFMVEMELLCREDPALRLIDRDEILEGAPKDVQRARYPFRWNTRVRHHGQHYDLAIAPDYVFGIEQMRDDGRAKRRYYFVEIDRGTMPVIRRDIRQSSILRKARSYVDSFERSLPTKRFGMSGFQVLFIVKSDQRMADIQAAIKASDLPSLPAGLFLFRYIDNTQASLRFSEMWSNLRGKQLPLC